MKKLLTVVILICLTLCLFSGCQQEQSETITLNVFNWGEYISDGEGSWEYEDEDGNIIEIPYLDINKEFEEYYQKIRSLPGFDGFYIWRYYFSF